MKRKLTDGASLLLLHRSLHRSLNMNDENGLYWTRKILESMQIKALICIMNLGCTSTLPPKKMLIVKSTKQMYADAIIYACSFWSG